MKKKCLYCQKEFDTHTKQAYCCKEHQIIRKNLLKFPDGSDYVECKICKFRATNLYWHIRKCHHISMHDYCEKYGIDELDLVSKSYRQHNADMQKLAYAEGRLQGWGKGDKNPSKRKEVKDGKKSIFSMNYIGYDGMSDEEKKLKISQVLKECAEKKKRSGNNPLTIDYYLKRGFSQEEAKEQLKARQSTFTYEKCINKYGEEVGKKIFQERQCKWQSTLNSKPLEEIERINKAKLFDGRGWSKISQQLFDSIANKISEKYSKIFYATNCKEKENNEYMVIDPCTCKKFFLDFYVEDNNKVIEFDGDYWHGEKRGNQQRDMEREEKLKQLGFTNILHVQERDYRKDPDKVVKQCIKFIES